MPDFAATADLINRLADLALRLRERRREINGRDGLVLELAELRAREPGAALAALAEIKGCRHSRHPFGIRVATPSVIR
jgi:hypothetical protein